MNSIRTTEILGSYFTSFCVGVGFQIRKLRNAQLGYISKMCMCTVILSEYSQLLRVAHFGNLLRSLISIGSNGNGIVCAVQFLASHSIHLLT